MFDPAILLSLQTLTPPQPPVTAQERVWLSPAGEAAQRVSQKLVEAYSAQADEWERHLAELKTQLHVTRPNPPEDTEVLSLLDQMIEEYEAHAEIRAAQSGRLVKRIRRDVKAMFQADPSIGAVGRTAGAKLIATDRRIVDELLEFSLVLRSIRAEASGEDQGGPTFDDPEALKRHLDSLAA